MNSAISEVIEKVKALRTYETDLKKQFEINNQEIDDLYHVLEFVALPASKMIVIAKKLKIALIDRRRIKEELSVLDSFKCQDIAKMEPEKFVSDREKNENSRRTKYAYEANEAYAKIFNLTTTKE